MYPSGRCPKSFQGFHNLKNLLKTSENTGNLNIWKLMSLFVETSEKIYFWKPGNI